MADDVKNKEQEKPPQPTSNGWQVINFGAFNNPPVWLAASVYVLAGLMVLAVLSLVAVGLYATFQIAYESVTGELKDRVEAAKVFFPILLALVGGPLLIWRVVTAHVQATAARHQADVAQEGLYTSLFTKAVEQLGATREVKETIEIDDAHGVIKRETITKTEPNLEVRLGAIYALDRVARDSERDHWPIMEVLCAYIRNPQNCGTPSLRPVKANCGSKEFYNWIHSLNKPRVDIQAAINVLSARLRVLDEKQRDVRLNLTGANLQCVFFSGNFSRTNFFEAYLDGASLMMLDLEGAWFNASHLNGVSLAGSRLEGVSFSGAELVGAHLFVTDLSKAKDLTSKRVNDAVGDASTMLPSNVDRPSHWPKRELKIDEQMNAYYEPVS